MNPVNKQDTPVILVTGSARRIGAGIINYFHQLGFRVVIHGHHSQQEANHLMTTLNQQRAHSAMVVIADLCCTESAGQLIEKTIAWAGRLDVLVNNASVFSAQDADWDVMFALNTKAPYVLSHAAYPHLMKHQGLIVNITDIHADKPLKGYAVYCQTKAALGMQTKALAREFAPHVRVNAVAPGAIMWPEHANQLNLQEQARIIEKTPLKQHGQPLFIAQAIESFVNNAFITGQTLCVDGGRCIV